MACSSYRQGFIYMRGWQRTDQLLNTDVAQEQRRIKGKVPTRVRTMWHKSKVDETGVSVHTRQNKGFKQEKCPHA